MQSRSRSTMLRLSLTLLVLASPVIVVAVSTLSRDWPSRDMLGNPISLFSAVVLPASLPGFIPLLATLVLVNFLPRSLRPRSRLQHSRSLPALVLGLLSALALWAAVLTADLSVANRYRAYWNLPLFGFAPMDLWVIPLGLCSTALIAYIVLTVLRGDRAA